MASGTHCVSLFAASLDLPLGGKARTLAQLQRAGFPVLPGVVVLPTAFTAALAQCNGDALRVGDQRVPPGLCATTWAELHGLLAQINPTGGPLVVRSSALAEDGAHHSFAGQLDSVVGVQPRAVEAAIGRVWRSAFAPAVVSYRQQQGLPPARPPAVLIQPLVNPQAAGVGFGADPVSGQRGVTVVSAVRGLPGPLVAGDIDGDRYRIGRDGVVLPPQLGRQGRYQRWDGAQGQVVWVDRDVQGNSQGDPPPAAILNDGQILAVAQLVQDLSAHQNRPQDVEWALVEGTLYLLQCRPITTLAHQSDPDGTYGLWDNSNLVESYSGITTPLTISFARTAYTEVYRQFCRFMGVPARRIARHRMVFANMVGCLQGRLYYNLLNWYRVLTLLPGYGLNARFLEQMLGVDQGLPPAVMADIRQQQRVHPLADALDLARSAVGIGANYLTLDRRIGRYRRRLNRVLLSPEALAQLPRRRPEELGAIYRRIEGELLAHWDAPLINDFFAMIFYGVLGKLVGRWAKEASPSLTTDLISHTGQVISAEPARRMADLAKLVASHPPLVTTLCRGSLADIEAALAALPPAQRAYQAYLDTFGDRCLEELKLESPTLTDDPLPLLRTVGYLAQRGTPGPAPGPLHQKLATQELWEAVGPHPLRRWVLGGVLGQTRRLVRNRENLRFERTRVFGQARRVFMELGKRFYALDLLHDPRDIVYLEVGEILGLLEGHATTPDLAGLVALRQRQFRAYRGAPPLPRRLETWGLPHLGAEQAAVQRGVLERGSAAEAGGGADPAIAQWQGTGCAPGRVRGQVRHVRDPRTWLQQLDPTTAEPAILVTTTTDPGWVLLFPHARGLVVERGSVLSHVAIVARELGLPMVSNIPAITTALADGDWVELDGHSGHLQRWAGPPADGQGAAADRGQDQGVGHGQ